MRLPREEELLGLWEKGISRHPIDLALLLSAVARPDLDPQSLASLPLGLLNSELLRLRAALFGNHLEIQVVCPGCQEVLEVPLALDEVLAEAHGHEMAEPIRYEGFCFRQPNSRDLAEIAQHCDAEAAALQLLDACCLARPAGATISPELLAQVDARLAHSDPLADLQLTAFCPTCHRPIAVEFDPGIWLWAEVQDHVRQLFEQIHLLATAYGWTEGEILALSPPRRKMYLALVNGG